MYWVIAALFLNIIESIAIAYSLQELHILIVLPLFYFLAVLSALIFIHSWAMLKNKYFPTQKEWHAEKHYLIPMIASSIIGNGIWVTLIFLMGLGKTSISLLVTYTLIHIYAYLFLKEEYCNQRLAALFFTLAGFLIFSMPIGNIDDIRNLSLIFIGSIAFSVEKINQKHISVIKENKLSPEKIIFVRQVLHAAFFLFFSTIALLFIHTDTSFTSISWLHVSILCLGAIAGGWFANIYHQKGLETLQLNKAIMIRTLRPVGVTIASVLLLGEVISNQQLIGGTVMLISVFAFFFRKK